MGRLISYNRRELASKRLRFLIYEIVPIFLIIFVFLIIEWMLLPLLVIQTSALFGLLFYLIRALVIFFGIVFFLFISNRFGTKNSQLVKKELTPHRGFLKLYTMTKKNYIYQLLYSVLILFLILIPFDFLISITSPESIFYRASSLVFKAENSFLFLNDITLFFLYSIIIQLSLSFSKETIFRGLIVKRGSEHFNKISAVVISTFYFTFVELFLNPIYLTVSFYFGIIWVIKSFIVGLVSSLIIIRRKWLFPMIIAKAFETFLSSIIIWDFLKGGNTIELSIFIYFPLFFVGLILLILQRLRIKESLQIGIEMLKSYFQKDLKLKESSGDKNFRILFDILIAFLLFLFGFLISA